VEPISRGRLPGHPVAACYWRYQSGRIGREYRELSGSIQPAVSAKPFAQFAARLCARQLVLAEARLLRKRPGGAAVQWSGADLTAAT
jgi:hypothetical protein